MSGGEVRHDVGAILHAIAGFHGAEVRDALVSSAQELAKVDGALDMLHLSYSEPRANCEVADGVLPGAVYVGPAGYETGELLIWMEGGRVDVLEYASWGDARPTALPTPAELRFVVAPDE